MRVLSRFSHHQRVKPCYPHQSGGGLVEDGEGGLVVQQPGESEPLLLPEREQVGPVPDGVEAGVSVTVPHHRGKASEIDLNRGSSTYSIQHTNIGTSLSVAFPRHRGKDRLREETKYTYEGVRHPPPQIKVAYEMEIGVP